MAQRTSRVRVAWGRSSRTWLWITLGILALWGVSLRDGPLMLCGLAPKFDFQIKDGAIGCSWSDVDSSGLLNQASGVAPVGSLTYYSVFPQPIFYRCTSTRLRSFGFALGVLCAHSSMHACPPRCFAVLPLWEPTLAAVAITACLHIRERRRASRSHECQTCGYNLTGNVSGICPECGTKIKIAQTDASPTSESIDSIVLNSRPISVIRNSCL